MYKRCLFCGENLISTKLGVFLNEKLEKSSMLGGNVSFVIPEQKKTLPSKDFICESSENYTEYNFSWR